ncbi:LAME_0G00364g1_1 [Lachancea meyersii CBS 8951]|uniref:LAME_0G00364g1_1 n=1 Tax=Lachancea meyersii CBS 8951 TaxID=1266667 RepID=A0A1G4K4U3_9SACH|nr:LAME_0G00364g1_1 [Lachancea meyersii CBS 8951]
MSRTTDEKLVELRQLFPDYDSAGLLDVLVSCDGSLKRTKLLLGATSEGEPEPRTKRFKSQQTLSRFVKDTRVAATTVMSRSSKPIALHTKVEIETALKYCTYHTNVLPEDLAERLLQVTLNDPHYKATEFWLFGKKCTSNHLSRIFLPTTRPDALYYNGKQVTDYGVYCDEMMVTQVLIEDIVNEALSQRVRLPFQTKSDRWQAQAALSNKYERDSNLDWHSDRLTNIGPHPIIASLSLGFSREFRVRKTYPSDSQIYSIKPQHNSLLIMHAGFQEEYKHCVPLLPTRSRISTEDLHPTAGARRINITYRNYLIKDAIFCKLCGAPMDLRRMFKDPEKRGKYFYQCSKSYTEQNGFNEGNECKGFSYANFDNDPPLTDNEDHCSSWLDEDDIEPRAHSGTVRQAEA